LLQEGVAAAKSGDKPLARSLLLRALEHDSNNEIGWQWLAYVADTLPEAIEYLRRVLAINPQNSQAQASLNKVLLRHGIALAKEGSKPQARELLLEASSLNPGAELVWLWLASVAERPADAANWLQKTLEINPNNQQAISWLNQLRSQNGAAKPSSKQSWQCPFCATISQGKLLACPGCRAVLTLADLNAVIENRQADRKLLTRAIEHYQNLVESNEEFSAHYYLGLAHLNLNQLSEAIAHLRKASQLRPDAEALKTHLAALAQRQKAMPETFNGEQRRTSPLKTILVVDDSATVRKLVQVILERCGHQVLTASGMMEALTKLEEAELDLVLLDICMPRIDGYQLCKIIKGANSDVPVVMLSGKDGFLDKVRGRMAGAVGYITKPFEPAALIRAVETHCNQNRPGERKER